ncbi:MAG: cysteine hydrolase family protein [Proteobacteria bacterium]|nr:cysteine hydrolase family protein [Pseudomonadota bacterium]
MSQALLLIDIQNDYFPGGAMALEGSIVAGLRAGELLAACRQRGVPVVHVQHLSTRPGATFFVPNSAGVEIHSCVAPLAGEAVIHKNFPNSFRNTGLLEHLRGMGCDELLIGGMMSNMCIDATVRAAADLGFRCRLAHDACAARALSFNGMEVSAAQVHAAFMAALQGLYAEVAGVEKLLAGLP